MAAKYTDAVKKPANLSKRVEWLRDYYFSGLSRKWNNEYSVFSTGTPHDMQFNELTYYIVPEMYSFMDTFRGSCIQAAKNIDMGKDFFKLSIPERRALFIKEATVNHLPLEILPNDLLAGARFNMQASMCLTKKETIDRDKRIKEARASMKFLYEHGYGNSGATSGHLIPDYKKIIEQGFKAVYQEIEDKYNTLTKKQKNGKEGSRLRAMMTAATMPKELALKYSELCYKIAKEEHDEIRKKELIVMGDNLKVVPWEGAQDFYQAVQSLWLTHMLVMTDENYPGPGVSFGRFDQYMYPYYLKSIENGMSEEFMKEILGCLWVHCNTVYDAQIRVGGNQGITAGFGQLMMLSGMDKEGKDLTNELTYLILDVIDDITPMLEPKPNIRLHRNSPDKLLNKIVDMVAKSQGAPFLLNFDERSMAGMLRQAKESNAERLINLDNVADYASVGCLENTMVGNDRSGTVDNNLNLLKAMELVYGNGMDMLPFLDEMTGKLSKIVQEGPKTGALTELDTFDKFYEAFSCQIKFIIMKMVLNYELSESIRADYNPTPYLSLLVKGCIDKCKDITEGGAELSYTTIEGVTFATTVDSLLAVKYLVYDNKDCTLSELVDALKANWEGYEVLRAKALNRAPKYGRDDTEADKLGLKVMNLWADEVWKYKTISTERQFRPGMLSWNYWIGSGYILKASANGRKSGEFLSNAICPSNGADINGPTSNSNSVGNVLGGKATKGDYLDYMNNLPNGASHTITFNTSLIKKEENKDKFKAFLKGYIENGGTALQINILDTNVLKEAQAHPSDYRHLLVRITGYNAYFTSIGRELQDEIIARESHKSF